MLFALAAATGVLALLTLAPGPDTAVVTRAALVSGRGAGMRAGLGVVAGLLLWGVLAVLGLAALLAASPTAYLVLKVVGVGYLLVLGVRAWVTAGRHELVGPDDVPTTTRRPFLAGLTTNVLNPKIAVFYAALLPTLAPPGSGPGGLALLVAVHVGLTLAWYGGFTWLLDRARAAFERPRVRRALDRLTGVVLVGFAVRLAVDTH